MPHADDDPDIAETLAYVADHPDQFTKKEMASVMRMAAEVIETLRLLVGIREDIELEDEPPRGNA